MLNKNLLLAAAFGATLAVASMPASAAAPGFYVGGQAGWGDTHYSKSDLVGNLPAGNLDNTGIAGRLFAGYQFDQNWAAELGFTKFSDTKIKNIAGTGIDGKVKQHAFDLVGKGILPLENGFNLYGKLGVAYVSADPSASYEGVTVSGDTEHKLYPTFSAGLSYDITPNVPVDISWNRIQKIGNGDIQSSDFIALGIAYNFG